MRNMVCTVALLGALAACAPNPGAPPPPPPAPAPTTQTPPATPTTTTTPQPSGPAQTGGSSPPAVEASFYAAYKTISHTGLPSAAERAKLEPFITADLDQLLIKASAADAARPAAKRFKGDPFTSNPAGATGIDLGNSCNWGGTAGNTGICYPQLTDGAASWKDEALVIDVTTWLVYDIVYGGTGAGDNKGKLTDLLKKIASP